MYKILSKILANRLKQVMCKLISKCQSAFLPQRQILDGVVVLNEIIDLAKRRKDECLLFKVDFERAYDSVNWGFLEKMMIKMGFSEGWLKWMRACIFESSMSILVNGSPTGDFTVGRGLRQGDPLSPFLFLIVAEGLAGLVRRAVEIGNFKGYQVNPTLQFQILQFADDTILMGEGVWDNLWAIKVVLRSFELVSGMRINFVKSKLYGINVDTSFLQAGSLFLNCNSDVVPFKFLGIPVGSNPRRRATWKPVVEAMSNRLSSWTSRHLSMGGRITLINSVLASMPLYFFSFYKAPQCVIKQLVRIQRNFLWGGGVVEKKLCWVKWDLISLPKSQGGLGVKNLALFNSALLSKWKWRCIDDRNALWADLLSFRYGHLPTKILGGITTQRRNKDSTWWKDLLSLEKLTEEDWFKKNVSCGIGNGCNIGFWKFRWWGNQPFCELFPNLYEKEVSKDVLVSSRLRRVGGNMVGNWAWSERLSYDEVGQLAELQNLLINVQLQPERRDRWRWIPGTIGQFSVNSSYKLLLQAVNVVSVESSVLEAIQNMWKNDVPTKVNIFGWRLLLDKLPTREALHHRGIMSNSQELYCTFCFHQVEDAAHLFFLCPFASYIWEAIFKWIGKSINPTQVGRNHFNSFGALIKSRHSKRVRHLIWLATTWCIWRLRNKIVFNGGVPNVSQLVDEIKYYSWAWFRGRSGSKSFLSFYDWCVAPLICFQSI
jgi:hypothetical protein